MFPVGWQAGDRGHRGRLNPSALAVFRAVLCQFVHVVFPGGVRAERLNGRLGFKAIHVPHWLQKRYNTIAYSGSQQDRRMQNAGLAEMINIGIVLGRLLIYSF